MNTHKQHAILIERTINEIRSHRRISKKVIKKVCDKYGMNESYIRKIAEWQPLNTNHEKSI